MTKSKQALLVLPILAVTLLLMLLLLPKGMLSSDLSPIGRGKPALVLAFENYSPASMESIDLLKRAKAEHGESLHFLVADVGTPEGRMFIQRFNSHPGMLMSFSAQGQLLAHGSIADTHSLAQRIAADFGN